MSNEDWFSSMNRKFRKQVDIDIARQRENDLRLEQEAAQKRALEVAEEERIRRAVADLPEVENGILIEIEKINSKVFNSKGKIHGWKETRELYEGGEGTPDRHETNDVISFWVDPYIREVISILKSCDWGSGERKVMFLNFKGDNQRGYNKYEYELGLKSAHSDIDETINVLRERLESSFK